MIDTTNNVRKGARRAKPGAAPAANANAVGATSLRYVSDREPGIRRVRWGGGFSYVSPDGRRIADAAQRRRISALAIPPAWRDVWISPDPQGHILATGRDSRGRKQYIYHPLWHEMRTQDRFSALLEFGRALPRMRAEIDRDLALPTLSRERVLALVVRLLDATLIRVGNREYAKQNDSYGLTTLRRRHVRRDGNQLRFSFRGKSGKEFRITLRDPRAANALRRCEELPGQEIFRYVDESGAPRSVQSQDVNDYVRAHCGPDFSAKDLRTWGGTVVAARTLLELAQAAEEDRPRDAVKAAIARAAHALGNTVAVARRHYVHPAVLAAHEAGTLEAHRQAAARSRATRHSSLEERVVLRILRAERDGARRGSRRPRVASGARPARVVVRPDREAATPA